MSFVRHDNQFIVTAILPEKIQDRESKCEWKLSNSDSMLEIVKQCFGKNKMDCGDNLPLCKNFTITDVPDTHGYHLTVYYRDNHDVNGVATIKMSTYILFILCDTF